MSGGGSSTTTNKVELPKYVQPYAEDVMGLAGNIANTPYEAYQGQLNAGFAPQQQQAMAMTQARALNGNPTMNIAGQQASATLGGDYLYRDTGLNPMTGQNPYLQSAITNAGQSMADNYARGTGANTLAQFRNGGAFGGSAHQEMTAANNKAFADSLANMENSMRMQDYTQGQSLYENYLNRNEQAFQGERGRQMQAMGYAPVQAANDYTDIQALAGVGDVLQGHAQQNLNTDYQQWLQAQQYPMEMMNVLSSGITGATGGGIAKQATGPNPNQSNPIAGALGGAATGAGIGSMIPGIGTAWGAGIGGLLGLLG